MLTNVTFQAKSKGHVHKLKDDAHRHRVGSFYFNAKLCVQAMLTEYSITSLVRASLVRGPSVVRGFERQNFSSHPLNITSK